MKNIEVEKRYSTVDKGALVKALEEKGSRTYEKRQIDRYFIPKHRNFLAEEHPFEWLRLRNDGRKQTLTYKHWYPEGVVESTHCDEYESEIGDSEGFLLILKALDFEEIIIVDKERTSYKVGEFEVSIDDVANLGVFIEIEVKFGYENVDEGLKLISDFAKKLPIKELPEDHPVRVGYPLPLYRKMKA